MRTTKWLLWLFGLLSATIYFNSPAVACSCIFDIEPAEYLREADLIFEGELISTEQSDGIETTATLRVLTPLKGRLGDTVTLDQSKAGMCAVQFKPGKKVRVTAYGDASNGYSTSICSDYFMQSWERREELYLLAWANRDRTNSLTGSDRLQPNETQLRALLRWLAEYRALEEGLDAADRLLAFRPGDREARLSKARFLSELNRNSQALLIAQVLLAKDRADADAQRVRVFSLVRLKRSSELPGEWKDFAGLRAFDADFQGRHMSGAVFKDTELYSADFSSADLSDADFSRATLSSAEFSGANLARANLLDISVYYGANFTNADLRGAVLANAGLEGVSFNGADARDAILTHSGVEGDLSDSDLRGADLRGTYFGAQTNWTGAKLQRADLREAEMGGNIAKADLTGALYNDKTVFPSGFDPEAAGAIRVED